MPNTKLTNTMTRNWFSQEDVNGCRATLRAEFSVEQFEVTSLLQTTHGAKKRQVHTKPGKKSSERFLTAAQFQSCLHNLF